MLVVKILWCVCAFTLQALCEEVSHMGEQVDSATCGMKKQTGDIMSVAKVQLYTVYICMYDR